MPVDRVTQGVAQAAAVQRPVDPVTTVTSESLHRDAGAGGLDPQRVTAFSRQRCHVNVVQLFEGDPLAIRRGDDLFGAFVLDEPARVRAVELHAGQEGLAVVTLLVQQPLAVGAPAQAWHAPVGAAVRCGRHQS